ncbi:hypothetical protein C2845_PM07G20650 [Panicum miliaceum]|uniref:Zinc knuckle CX2CX4HX4C domain-containing protein n=1 Tax=Panicum miliaceum TaxID=4540 RepID=A0A3L6SN15_PANMI|nr:hypothetical protein C2845_PM07G20650 [Panicum miliaceum]
MTRARETRRPQFLAVGLFLSVLLVKSKQLIDHMKKVWNLRGQLEASTLESEAGRKFILVFSEEGDRKHAILAGPWQYKMDVFLVESLAEGDDPSSVPFTHVPMWIQFRNIPFYLLTKKLAFDLGECIGSTLMVDNNARGSISDKFVRTRAKLPLYRALRMELVLVDEITGEEVAVQIRYERLPNFCLFCGFIGHMEARCDVPMPDRKIMYNLKLRVLPVHFEFPHTWFLPDAMGHASPQRSVAWPWRAPTPASKEEKQDVP